jgi:hypothetical protein
MVFIEYPKQGIVLLLGFGRVCNTLPSFKKTYMEPNVFMGYPSKGIADVLSSFGHEQ